MIRAFLFALLLTIGSQRVFAQQPAANSTASSTVRVILLADSARYGISPDQLQRTHRDYFELVHRAPKEKQKALAQKDEEHGRAWAASLEAQGKLPINGTFYEAQVFYRPNGTAEWVLVNTPPDGSTKAVDDLLNRLTVFYQKTSFPQAMKEPFSTTYMSRFGHFIDKRVVRTGDSTISTIEAAQATARPDTVKYLYFNQLELKAVPDVVYRFSNLEELDLSKNGLTQLPARLTADLPRLQRLTVLFNQIGDDSVFITKNKHLLALTLQGNKLTRIPTSVRNARRLLSLWMGNNKLNELNVRALRGLRRLVDFNLYNAGLTSLPKQVRKLKHVRVMDLYYNELTSLPKQMGKMRRLEQLAVAHNKLTSLPPQLARLSRLDTLYVHHNPLADLPGTFDRFKYLRLIDMGYSQFSEFPAVLLGLKTLESIDLTGNNIQVLPPGITQLTDLKVLHLRSNPVTRDDAKSGPYAKVINQLEAQNTAVYY